MIEEKKQDPASKLEQGYIQMFLGKLEPMQESRWTILFSSKYSLKKWLNGSKDNFYIFNAKWCYKILLWCIQFWVYQIPRDWKQKKIKYGHNEVLLSSWVDVNLSLNQIQSIKLVILRSDKQDKQFDQASFQNHENCVFQIRKIYNINIKSLEIPKGLKMLDLFFVLHITKAIWPWSFFSLSLKNF